MEIKICVGSSCHLKGAPSIIEKFQEVLKIMKVADYKISELGACFCQGYCQDAVVVLINGVMHTKVTSDQVEDLVKEGMSHGS